MKIRLKLFIFLAAMLQMQNIFAVPAAPLEIQLTQPDGTKFTAIPRGDEYANWTETSEGHSIVKSNDTWFYAESDGYGGLRASNLQVGQLSNAQKQQLPLHLAPAVNSDDVEPVNIRKLSRSNAQPGGPEQPQTISFTQYVLTILVEYDAPGAGTDTPFTYSDASFQALMYGVNNSVKDFFLENSYNGFTIAAPIETQGANNDGIIHVTRPVAHPNQGGNSTVSRSEARLIVALADPFIDYSSYDANSDGTISADELSIVIILAGYETSFGGDANAQTPNVWGHKTSFNNITLDGVVLAPYTMFGEAHSTKNNPGGKHQATIGIMCHELGHLMLGLPDLYDYSGNSEGIGNWGLMGGGSWNSSGGSSGNSPAHMNAWSKVSTKFTLAQDVDSNQNGVSLAKADANEVAKRLWIDKYKVNQYFLVENRQKTGYDAGLPGSGMLIWHVDDTRTSNSDETHKWVDLEEADGLAHLDSKTNRGDTGDPFPGSTSNTTFNNSSNPNSKNYLGQSTGIGVTSISASAATMTANMAVLTGGMGDNVRYDETRTGHNRGYSNPTAWVGLRTLNDTARTIFDGVDIFVTDPASATIDIHYYTSMVNGTPAGLIHSQTGFAAVPGWNRLLLTTPQSFPIGAERGVVLKIVNNTYGFPVAYDGFDELSGRSYMDSNGLGTFSPMCPTCGDINMVVLFGTPNTAPSFTPASAIARQQGSPAGTAVTVGTAADDETPAGNLAVTQIAGGSSSGITTGSINNSGGTVTATLAASCSATSGTVRFQASDGELTGAGDLQLNISANSQPTLTYEAKSLNLGAGSTHAASTGPSDNGSISSVVVQSQGGYTGGISVNATGLVTLSNAQPVGTHTITIRATDNCAATRDANFQLQVNPVAPGAPNIGTATAGNAQASVAFTPPASNGGAAISSYTATSNPGSLTGVAAASPITVTGLTNGVAYTFTITATNSAGTGPASSPSNAVTPKAPQTISFANPGVQSFGTTPNLSATASSSLPVSFSSTTMAVCTITSGGALTFLTTGNCSINADQAGNGSYLPAPTVTQAFSVIAVVPGAPTIEAATAGDTQAMVAFSPPASNGGAAISNYTATSSPGGLTGSAANSPATVTGLTNGVAYTFTVTATNSAGTGAPSSASNAVTPKATQTISFANPGAQQVGTSPTLTATADSGLTVSFSSSTPAICTITTGGTLTLPTSGICTIDANQAGNVEYLPAPEVSQSFMVNDQVPGAPVIGTARAYDSMATVSFNPPGSSGGSPITSYTATSQPGGITGNGTASPISVNGLVNGVSYTFTVTATNDEGSGPPSSASNAVTPQVEVFVDSFEQ